MAAILAHKSLFTFAFVIVTLFIVSIFNVSHVKAENSGFIVELIHRDSPRSPFYDPSSTPSQRVAIAVQRSLDRLLRFVAEPVSPDSAQSTLISSAGEYLMELSIGTPPVKIFAIADTGSDVIWTQCEPCPQCYKQVAPLFDPKSSSTYKEIPCYSPLCQTLSQNSCLSSTGEACHYKIKYGDGSYSKGILSHDTVTIDSGDGRSIAFPKTVFGCGHNNDGFDKTESGIIGLGYGPASLISQISSSIGGKFSYCLVPEFSNPRNLSKINFGTKAVVKGPEVVSTPLIIKDNKPYYFVTLEAISVGDSRFEFVTNSSSGSLKEGNIIIDSGARLTILTPELYHKIQIKMIESIDLPRVSDPREGALDLCFKTKSDIDAPIITAHFKGADIKLDYSKTFVRITKNIVCFAFTYPKQFSASSLSIFGNVAQTNLLVGYDVDSKTLSFKPTDCNKE